MERIGVLGPLTVDGDGVRLPPREQVVLAALTVRRGEVVSAETLADAWWGEQLPATWTKALQGCLVQLRKVLGAGAIETRPRGYCLVVPADEVDACRFERQMARARELLTLGEADRAAHVVDEALGLWRGRALVDLDGWEPGRVEATRLEELRLDAEELRVEATLQVGRFREVLAEAQALVDKEQLREHRWTLLALAQYQAGRQGDALRTLRGARRVLVEELGLDPGPGLVALEEAILRQDPSLVTAQLPEPSPVCPYLGLVPYDIGDADAFFGRDADVSECLRRLADSGVLAIVGPSGSGKSSVVRAGIAAALQRDGRKVVLLAPGARPTDALSALPTSRRGSVLVVDQCEEAVTLCTAADERSAFLAALVEHAEEAPLVVALRADRLGELSAHPGFARIVERGLFLLQGMGDDDLRAAIEGPARQAGLRLEPGLVDLLVREVEGEPGALPLLSHALRQTWQRREGRTLTVAGYQASGGIRGAVAQSAEQLYEQAPPEERPILRDLLLRLVAPSPEGEPVRSRVPRRTVANDAQHEQIIEQLIRARLVTSDKDMVELAHEALARAWPRLRDWLDDDVEGQRIWRHITAVADAWDAMGRPDSELYRGVRLDQAVEWRARATPDLNAVEQMFLDASETARDRGRQREADQLKRTARANRRLRAQLVALGIALVVALVVGVVAVRQRDTATRERRIATARELAAAANANLDQDPERSILLASEAVDVARRADGAVLREAEEALHWVVKRSRIIRTVPQGGFGLAVSSDGARFVTGGSDPDDATVTVWDTDTGEELVVLTGPDGGRGVAFSPDDRLLATAHGDGTVRLWDATTGDQLHVLRGHQGLATHPAFSPDGRWLAAGGEDGTVRVWDVATASEAMTLTGHRGVVVRTAFSPDGSRLATASDDATARIWDLATGDVAVTLTGHAWGVMSVDFSPDGRRIATAAFDAEARIWDAETGALLRTFAGPAPLEAAAFSPDGTRLATAGTDSIASVWDIDTGRELVRLAGHSRGRLGNLAFTPDGDRLLTAGLDGTTRLWDVSVAGARDWLTVPSVELILAGVAFSPDGATFAAPAAPAGVTIWDAATGDEVITLTGHAPKLTTVEFSPDGTKLVAASDLTDRPPVWDVRSGELLFTLDGHASTVRVAAFSPDGRRIVTGSLDTTARVWDVATGEQVGVLRDAAGAVDAVAYSPDGRLLVTGDEEGDVRVWDATTLEPVRTLRGHTNAVLDVAFGPDGMLVTASDDGTAKVWDVASGAELVTFRGHRSIVNQVAVSPDGARVATTGEDATTKLWDPATGRELLTLVGHDNLVYGVDFSPDGRLLATASPDGTTALHLLPMDEFRDLARARVTRGLTDQECRDYLHLAACP